MKLAFLFVYLIAVGIYVVLVLSGFRELKQTINKMDPKKPWSYRAGEWLGIYFAALILIVFTIAMVLFTKATVETLA